MVYTFKNLCQITEHSFNMRILLIDLSILSVSFKAALSIGIPRLKPHCSETSMFRYLFDWGTYLVQCISQPHTSFLETPF
jgi:hypothetical protein